MKRYFVLSVISLVLAGSTGCKGQGQKETTGPGVKTGKRIGGPCDGCEIMYAGMPSRLTSIDTSAGWQEEGEKILIKGKVIHQDGKTPAANVILYYWQTDNKGLYTSAPGMPEEATRHGHIRGWMKTDENGNYSLYTIKPGPYPNEDAHAHIHMLVREPGLSSEYYIDEFVFDDDPLLTSERRNAARNRGGSGILKLNKTGDLLTATHDIILGLNIPGYPK